MTVALICLDGYRVAAMLDAVRAALNPATGWLLLHVVDAGPPDDLAHAAGRLPGRDAGRHRAEERMRRTTEWSEADVRAAALGWLGDAGATADLIVATGRPEREIIRIADERGVAQIAIGAGRSLPGRHPGPGAHPLSPVARYVVDRARCDVLLLRGHVLNEDRRP